MNGKYGSIKVDCNTRKVSQLKNHVAGGTVEGIVLSNYNRDLKEICLLLADIPGAATGEGAAN